MNKNKVIFIALCLMFTCLILSAVSATDVNDTNLAVNDNGVSSSDNSINCNDEISDIQTEKAIINEKEDLNTINDKNISNHQNKANNNIVIANSWEKLKQGCENNYQTYVMVTRPLSVDNQITINNNVIVEGNKSCYITGNSSDTPFVNNNSDLIISFVGVSFKNIEVENLFKLSGHVTFSNCEFNNIQTGDNRNSVIYSTDGILDLINCNFTNCSTRSGVISGYGSTNVNNCNFINNTASSEPGAINNYGNLTVKNSEFIKNHADLWAGAIHTNPNANTTIEKTLFKSNTAGWNGGALYTYSKLNISNSIFEDNNCTTNNGGGAIGAFNFISNYDINIDSCIFKYNNNLCTETTALSDQGLGRGGAISVTNGGTLKLYNSNFTGNYAKIGQAISAATADYTNATGGEPTIQIYNNNFINHTSNDNETVYISGNGYIFYGNTFINSIQKDQYNETGNTYNTNTQTSLSEITSKQTLTANKKENKLKGTPASDYYYVNSTREVSPMEMLVGDCNGQSWDDAYGSENGIVWAIYYLNTNGTVYIAEGNYVYGIEGDNLVHKGKNVTVVGLGNITYLSLGDDPVCSYPDITTVVNCTIIKSNIIGENFINCTFIDTVNIKSNSTESVVNFNNCIFNNINTVNSIVNITNGQANFINCTFKDINTDSIVSYNNASGFADNDSILFKDCTFSDSKFNAVSKTPFNPADDLVFENCTFDEKVSTAPVVVNITDETSNQTLSYYYVNYTIKKVKPYVKFFDDDKRYITNPLYNPITIVAVVDDGATGNVTFVVRHEDDWNTVLENVTVNLTDSRANFTFTPTKTSLYNCYMVYVDYNGDEQYEKYLADHALSIYVLKLNSNINIDSNSRGDIILNLTDEKNNPIANATIKYSINTADYNTTTNDEGIAVISNNTGKFRFTASFEGNNISSESEISMDMFVISKINEKINTTIESHDFSQTAVDFYNNETGNYFTVTLKDINGNPLVNKTVTIGFNGVVYTRNTTENGSAQLQINLRTAGDYTFATAFLGDDDYAGSFVVNTIHISKKVSRIVLSGNSPVKVNAYRTLTISLQGQRALNHNSYITAANKTVKVTVNGRTYSVRIGPNKKGTLRVRFTRAGTYTITTKFAGDGTYSARTLTSKITVRR